MDTATTNAVRATPAGHSLNGCVWRPYASLLDFL